ncbi:MAG TPA: hypothetical protein VK810_01980 [Dongiaceae bacterium]|nr:hypothetical protein [Dongiaceae bacterium]
MADIPPIPPAPFSPAGAEPMKKSTGKVQPKKETVRINLPPKPSAAPTIKLPTLPPGGPTGASGGVPLQSAKTPPTAAAPRAAGVAGAAPVAQARSAAPAPQPRAAALVVVPTVSTFDKILAIAACIAALAAVGTTVWMMMILNAALSQ